MRSRRYYRRSFAWLTVLALAWAAAAEAPDAVATVLTAADADVLVTDARGVIVGVGRVVAGASFELRVLEGFVGPARLTLLRRDGASEALYIEVDGHVLVEGFDLLELLADRVEAFIVEVAGVAYRTAERRVAERGGAERRGADADTAGDDGPGHVDPPMPADTPGPPSSTGSPVPPGPRGPEGRP